MTDTANADQITGLPGDAQPEAGAQPSAKPRRPRRIRELDFSRPMKLNPVEQQRFETAHVTFCRDMAVRLSTELRSPIELELVDFAQLTWSAAVREIKQPSILAVASASPLESSVLLCLEEPIVLAMIERLLGGGVLESPASRTMTEIDMALARRVFGSLIDGLTVVWDELLGLRLRLADVAPQQSSVDLVPPSEPTLAITLGARDHDIAASISLLVPYSSIAAVSGRLSGMTAASDGAAEPSSHAGGAMQTAIGAVDVELRAEVGSTVLTMNEILGLRVGDVLRLGAVGGETLLGGDEHLHRVRPGLSGARRAVQIVERLGVSA